MKLKNTIYTMMVGAAVITGTTGCVSDLDQYPHTETTSKDVYNSLANYEAVLGAKSMHRWFPAVREKAATTRIWCQC